MRAGKLALMSPVITSTLGRRVRRALWHIGSSRANSILYGDEQGTLTAYAAYVGDDCLVAIGGRRNHHVELIFTHQNDSAELHSDRRTTYAKPQLRKVGQRRAAPLTICPAGTFGFVGPKPVPKRSNTSPG